MKHIHNLPRWQQIISIVLLVTTIGFLLSASSCDEGNSPQQAKETNQVDKQQETYQNNQPVHSYNYSPERDALQQIYDARMRIVDTWTVVYSYGKPIHVSATKGYPIPYTTQLTNTQRALSNGVSCSNCWAVTLPQAEPNGLFTGTTAATWILEVRKLPGGGAETVPVYCESEVDAFPYPVKIVDGQIVDTGNQSSTQIQLKDGK